MGDSCCNKPCGAIPAIDKQWLNMAVWLVSLTIVYNIAESVVAVWAGNRAESIALVGFGLDSLIEVSAAALMLWRLLEQMRQKSDEAVEKAESTVHRFVGISFFVLAAYIGFDAIQTLARQEPPHESIVGIVLAILSLIIMPTLAYWKIKAAKAINSTSLQAEAKETIACSVLSLILLVGLAANALAGWWWADPVAGLCMLPWLIKEGIAGLKGEGCCG